MTTIPWSDQLSVVPSTEKRRTAFCGPAQLFLDEKGKLRKNLKLQVGEHEVPITRVGKPFIRRGQKLIYAYSDGPIGRFTESKRPGLYRTRGLI
jgi:hypothetical protein